MINNPLTIDGDKLKSWLHEVSQLTVLDGIARDLHIDQILQDKKFAKFSSSEKLNIACFVFDCAAEFIQDATSHLEGVMVYMDIPLICENTEYVGPPKNLMELTDLFDPYSVPEIIVYKDQFSKNTPLIELHRLPITFEISNFRHKDLISPFYIESRVLDGQWQSDEYSRVVNLLFTYR